MKCPDCGEEAEAGAGCPKCGRQVSPSVGVKVEYKDFKGSEMLDIQMTGKAPSGNNAERPVSRETNTPRPVKPAPVPEKPSNIPLLVAVALAVILAAAAGYYLGRVLGLF